MELETMFWNAQESSVDESEESIDQKISFEFTTYRDAIIQKYQLLTEKLGVEEKSPPQIKEQSDAINFE